VERPHPDSRQVLKGLALESGALPYSREFLARYNLTIGGTQRAVRALADMDLIEKDGGKYRLTDPVMNAWLV
jgi:hypothetical protein